MNTVTELLLKVRQFEKEAHSVLAKHERARSRVYELEDSYKTLTKLAIKQDELIRQALRCTENELFRAAHVLAWAGLMDYLEEKLASDGLAKVRAVRPKWTANTLEDLREYQAEYQIVEVGKEVGLYSKSQMKALHGLLNKRNECAHPSDFYPDLNETLGFISEVLHRIEMLRPKKI